MFAVMSGVVVLVVVREVVEERLRLERLVWVDVLVTLAVSLSLVLLFLGGLLLLAVVLLRLNQLNRLEGCCCGVGAGGAGFAAAAGVAMLLLLFSSFSASGEMVPHNLAIQSQSSRSFASCSGVRLSTVPGGDTVVAVIVIVVYDRLGLDVQRSSNSRNPAGSER